MGKLGDLIRGGYGKEEDLNCAETILYGANQVYQLGLDKSALKLAAGFGGGMAIEDKCGALTGAIMVLGNVFVEDRAHESDKIKELTEELFKRYQQEMGAIDCAPLKDQHYTEEIKCCQVIITAAELLDDIISRENTEQNT